EAQVFLDQCGGDLPTIDWETEMKASAVSYTGEEAYPSEPLSLERLVEAPPPPASAASSVDVLRVCEGRVRQALLNPSRALQAEDDVEVMPRAPRVWAPASEWGRIAAALVEGGISRRWLAVFKGKKVLGGMFGAHKGGYKRGEGPQTLVMNRNPSNAIQKILCGTGGQMYQPSLQTASFVATCPFLVEATGRCQGFRGDMSVPGGPADVSSLIESNGQQPQQTSEWPGGPAVSVGRLGRGPVGSPPLAGRGDVYIGRGNQHLELEASVWGNPFRLKVDGARREVIAKFGRWLRSQQWLVDRVSELTGCRLLCHCRDSQERHGDEIIKLWDDVCAPETKSDVQPVRTDDQCWLVWQVHIDNSDMMEVGPAVEMEMLKLAGRPEAMRAALERHEALGAPVSEAKAVVRESAATALGDFVNGEQGTIGPPGEFCRKVIVLAPHTLRRPRVTQKWLQVLAGRWVRMMLYRREIMTCFGEFWTFLVRVRGGGAVPDAVRRELVSALCLMPLMRCDLRVPISGLVTVSDASPWRGAVRRSVRLLPRGMAAACAAQRGHSSRLNDEGILLSLFDGIGGGRRALDFLGLSVAAFATSEVDEEAARVVRYSWPDVAELGDVANIARACLERVRERAPMAKWMLVTAGPPCTDLSRVKAGRKGLAGSRSRLFFDIERAVRLASEVMGEDCRIFRIIEKVASMDQEPLDAMSSGLGLEPAFIDGAVFSRCRRDRVYWVGQHVMVPWQRSEMRPERCG
ncbi:unnamed protein product, partial [Prorocentrum cordatum]